MQAVRYASVDGSDGGGRRLRVVCQARQTALPHLTSPEAESILAQACENESNNAKRMRMGLEALTVCRPMLYMLPVLLSCVHTACGAVTQRKKTHGAARRRTSTYVLSLC